MKALIFAIALLCLHHVFAQRTPPPRSLAVGDRLPHLTFTGVVNHPVSKIQYSEYSDRLLILDFWATWCSSCISHFPELHDLSEKFKGKLQVLLVPPGSTDEDSAQVKRFFAVRSAPYRLAALTKDSLLSRLFPHSSVPHYVWVSRGTVIAITDAGAITAQNIAAAINNTPIYMHEKKDRRYDADTALLQYALREPGNPLKASFTLTGYLDGMISVTGHRETAGRHKYYAINSPLLSLYSLAFPELTYAPASRITWNLASPDDYRTDYSNWDTWKYGHSYCMEFSINADRQDSAAVMIQSSLDNYFGLTTGFQERDMPCLLLEATPAFRHTAEPASPGHNTLWEKGVTRRLSGDSRELTDFLDALLPTPVINNLPGEWLDISLPEGPVTVDAARRMLVPWGLTLTPAKRPLRVFVISGRSAALFSNR